MKCEAITPPATDACGKEATYLVTFKDGTKSPACETCAIVMRQTAQSHGTNVAVERIDAKR